MSTPAEPEQQQQPEQAHVSYVKHLSSDENVPGNDQQQGGSFIDKVPGGWWTIGIGAATIIIGILTLRKMGSSSGGQQSLPSGSGAYYPYSTDTTAGNSSGTDNSVPSAMDSQLTGLLSQEQINNQVLQSILGNLTNSNPVNNPPPTSSGFGIGKIRAQFFSPQVKGWDSSHTGIPIHASAAWNSPITGYEAFGSNVNFTGNILQGNGNFGNNFGNTLWEPVAGGYISQYDLVH